MVATACVFLAAFGASRLRGDYVFEFKPHSASAAAQAEHRAAAAAAKERKEKEGV